MLDFEITLDSHTATKNTDPLHAVQELLIQLGRYGYSSCCTPHTEESAAVISITKDTESFFSGSIRLIPAFISDLSRFTEKAHVQATLDELTPRMALVGWEFGLDQRANGNNASRNRLYVNTPDGVVTYYSLTYADMTHLRRDLDIAEVTSLVESNMPKMLERGWRRTMDTDCYAFNTPDGPVVIAFNDVDKAREVTRKLYQRTAAEAFKDVTSLL